MSWKIYVAWRVPVARLNEALDAFREEMTRHFYEVWKMFADALNPDMNPLELCWQVDRLFKTDTCDNHQPMNCGAAIRFDDEGYAYFEPYGLFRIPEKMDKPADWFEDFAYWDNTDPPEDIDEEEWEARRKKWSEMIEYGNYTQQVSRLLDFVVYSPDNIPTTMAMSHIYLKDKGSDAQSSIEEEEQDKGSDEGRVVAKGKNDDVSEG